MTDLAPEVVVTPPGAVPDVVSVTVGGVQLSGWTDVTITRGCEQIPNTFELGLTAQSPVNGSAQTPMAGQACTVKVGNSTVVTGYIDRDTNGGDASSHRLSIIGRGLCSDLVDCSAEYPNGQIAGASAVAIATKLAEPYGISVYLSGSALPKAIPQFNLNYGETAQELIDRVCTYAGLLYYEDEYGDLVLSEVGNETAASGFVYGQNVISWSVENAMDQRFSDYVCAAVSVAPLTEEGTAGDLYFTAYDPNVARHRLKYLVAESVSGSQQLCELRALWEAARRAGRGTMVKLTCDSWRDSGGTLWTPNTLAPVTLPGLRLPAGSNLCISSVTYRYSDEGGTLCDLVLLPREAFTPEPIVIQPTPFADGELS